MSDSARRDSLTQRRFARSQRDWWTFCIWIGGLMAGIAGAKAAPLPDSSSPIGFFTNVASGLLASQLKVDLTRIEIYPTNHYTPAVHRLLQVAANVYEATTTNYYPSVFRPVFLNDGTNVFIAGYESVASVTNLADPQLAWPVDAAKVPPGIGTNLNVYGIPWIIGAKKGFPNFNELSIENMVSISRKLELTRPSVDAPLSAYQTNQMYVLSIRNSLGVECWNSYTNNYVSPQIQIAARDSLSLPRPVEHELLPR